MLVARRRAEADERQQRLALLVVLIEALLQHGAEIAPELRVVLGRVLGLLLQLAQHALHDAGADLRQQRSCSAASPG
jgi:hypothetical protein